MRRKPAWMTAHGRPWARDAGRVLFENPWLTLTEHQAVAPTGKAAVYGVVGFKNLALAILPLHADGTVTLVGQHRFPMADYSWEIPEGGGPLGTDPLEGARRELAEETGLHAEVWREVLRLQLSNSVTNERAIGYLAFDLSPIGDRPAADDTEELAIARPSFRQALAAAMDGHMEDALTVAMLLRAYHMAREGELPADLARAMLG